MKTLGGAFLTFVLLCFTCAYAHDDFEFLNFDTSSGCSKFQKASKAQIEEVQNGNSRYSEFLQACLDYGVQFSWCQQLARPNPSPTSVFIFNCTYGNLPHQLVSPDETTWEFAFKAGKMVQDLEKQEIQVEEIYNWWRPEPYNKNVRGAFGRHNFATSVDVRMQSTGDTKKALKKLCGLRKQHEINALGYYGDTAIHIGIGDNLANTWGNPCGK